jgi:hypothetical protein
MSDDEPAWSDQADAVYVATIASIDEMESYGERMNLLLNLTRYVTMTEVADGFARATKANPDLVLIEIDVLIEGMQRLIDAFSYQLGKMPRRMLAVMHAENGCGGCAKCKAAKLEAYADGQVILRPSKESRDAIEAIIATMRGKTEE